MGIKKDVVHCIGQFRLLVVWNIFFAAQDALWGCFEEGVFSNPTLFLISSSLFHVSTVIIANVWIFFVLEVIGDAIRRKYILKSIGHSLLLIQIILVVLNIFTPVIFTITPECTYESAGFRPLVFCVQYLLYVLAASVAVLKILKKKNAGHMEQYVSILFFVAAPILFGILQLLFPSYPFYTIGFLIGCTVIYSFVISGEETLFFQKYISEKDAQYQDYYDQTQKEIARNMEVLEAMADVYYSMHLIDLVENTVIPYSARDEVKKIVNKPTNASVMMKQVMTETVVDGYRDAVLEFSDLITLPERMKHKRIMEAQFIGTRIGWFIASFIAIETDSEDRPSKVIFTTRSIDEEKKKEQHLIYKSNTDEMTGFYNRRAFEDASKDYSMSGLEDDFVFVSIDINGLKVVNDTIGHAAGDELIVGACACMKKCLEPYGRLYRTGGDEFTAFINADDAQLEKIKEDLEETVSAWKGNLVKSVAISCGFVTRREAPELSLHEIAVMADKRMYEAKSQFYRKKGFDRRGQRDAHTALCAMYTKILKINLTEDTYQIVNMNVDEQNEEKGFAPKISQWFINFGQSGQVHPEDLSHYLAQTDLEYLKKHFMSGKRIASVTYRRMIEDKYIPVLMEIIPANDYSDQNQSMFLYVKNISEE